MAGFKPDFPFYGSFPYFTFFAFKLEHLQKKIIKIRVHRSLIPANYWPASGEEGWKGLSKALPCTALSTTTCICCCRSMGLFHKIPSVWCIPQPPVQNMLVADCTVLERRHSSRFIVLFRNPLAGVNQICHRDRSFKEKLILVNSS